MLTVLNIHFLETLEKGQSSCVLLKTDSAGVKLQLQPGKATLYRLLGHRHGERVRGVLQVFVLSFDPSHQLFVFIIFNGSRDLGVEEGVTEAEPCMGVDPEGAEGGSQLEMGAQRLSSCGEGAGLCLEG